MTPRVAGALSVLVTLLTPIVLVLLGLRILLSPLTPRIEYSMPGFPADDFGFSLQDRLRWSSYSLTYLLNSSRIEYLGRLRFDDRSPVFNERELSHMSDVKVVVRGALKVFYISLALMIGLGVYAWLGGWRRAYVDGLRRGGWLTVGIILGLGVLALTSFWNFFTLFHSVLFQGDSWLFEYSDTLIRLFPIRFWQDIFTFALGFGLLGGLLLGLFAKPRVEPPISGKV